MSKPIERPLSPHLQIYSPMFTMMMSIVHRITGAALYFGIALFVIWLLAAATSPAAFEVVSNLFGSWLGKIVLLGFTWALMHHALGGIRHLVWDTGAGFGPCAREWSARLTLIGSVALTALIWCAVFFVKAL